MKKPGRKTIMVIAASAIAVAGAFFALKGAKTSVTYSKDAFLLDTFCTITVYKGGSEEVLERAVKELKRYDALLSAESRTSDIYKINQSKEEKTEIGPETASMLAAAKEIEELSGGALWAPIRPVSELWDFKVKKELPDDKALSEALLHSRASQWKVTGNEQDGYFFETSEPFAMIEPGSFAKGFIADRVKEFLIKEGVESAVIDLGGNVHTIGVKPDGSPFRIGIKDPKGIESYKTVIEACDISVVTAGNYERYFIKNGKRYHHILDPETGYPVDNGLDSVTVSGPCSVVCDLLATASFVKGTEGGIKLIELYNKAHGTDYKGYFLDSEGEFTVTP